MTSAAIRRFENSEKPVLAYSIDNYLDITANWLYQQLSALRHHEAIILCNTRSNRDNFPHPHVYSVGDLGVFGNTLNRAERKLFNKTSYRHHLSAAKRHGVTLMHSHFGPRAFCDIEISEKLNVPLIASFYGVDATMLPKQDPRWIGRYRRLFEFARRIVVEAPNMKRLIIELGCAPGKILVNPLGVDLSTVEFRERRREGHLKLFIASSFREKKGIPDALEAIGCLKAKLPPFTVTIAGGVTASPDSRREEKRIHAVIRRWNLAGHVKFVGFLSRSALLAEALKNDVFIATSKAAQDGDTEGGTNIVLIEMAATGMPIITTRHCDLPTTMGELNQRWVADEGDIDSIAAAIEGIVTDNWAELGASNRRHVETHFDIRRCVDNLEAIYKDVEDQY